jgi:hypothetical protein
MLYAILCYDDEKRVMGWTKEEDDLAMVKLGAVQEEIAKKGKLGPVGRLGPTKSAFTLRKGGKESMVMDGPFAETKEVLLGFYIVDCETKEEALQIAKDLGKASMTEGCFEIRPLSLFRANQLAAAK